jgi:uncharacterized protein (DUF952 family)
MALIYKILPRDLWTKALVDGIFQGAAIDLTDGYIHLSTAEQAEETARRHFASQVNLVLAAFDPADFAGTLKWEASRGGALFPHVYGSINPAQAKWVKPLPLSHGAHEFPEGWNQ